MVFHVAIMRLERREAAFHSYMTLMAVLIFLMQPDSEIA